MMQQQQHLRLGRRQITASPRCSLIPRSGRLCCLPAAAAAQPSALLPSRIATQRRRTSGGLLIARYRNDASASQEQEQPPTDAEQSERGQQADLVPVEFVLGHRCEFGQRFAVVGDCEALGSWDVAQARPLEVGLGGGFGRGVWRLNWVQVLESCLLASPCVDPALNPPKPPNPPSPNQWHEGDVWSAVLPLPPNSAIQFKPVVISDADGSCVCW